MERGFKVTFEDRYCLIRDAADQDIFKVKMKGKSFALNPLEHGNHLNIFTNKVRPLSPSWVKENMTEVWHKRLGHYHHHGLLQMKFKNMAKDLLEFEDHIPSCKACQFDKLNRKPFPLATSRASRKLQLIHTDVCGPQRTPSLKGSL